MKCGQIETSSTYIISIIVLLLQCIANRDLKLFTCVRGKSLLRPVQNNQLKRVDCDRKGMQQEGCLVCKPPEKICCQKKPSLQTARGQTTA